ncbi:acetate--CoA ligase family protein, partial [Desulfovibrio sp. OttesenSCG-928-G15]|nr:acetate--CoA ligase family protein [Desulfovibrio sp. OttesenSCG-928-G15]
MPAHAHISALFSPRSVIVCGASRQKDKAGHIVLSNLVRSGYGGKIFPVNPEADTILGLPALSKPGEVPSAELPVDLGIICLPAAQSAAALRELAEIGVKAAVIISAGFKETGRSGAKLEEEIRQIAHERGIALLGPNCLGFVRPGAHIDASLMPGDCPSGDIGFFSQSGGLCAAIEDWAKDRHFGFSSFIHLGNKAGIDECDVLACLAEDPHTKVVVGYLENVENGQRFLHNAHQATRQKPVIMLKPGRSGAGMRAVSSHVGVSAGDDLAYDAAFRQTGIIRAERMEDLFFMARAFAEQPLPKGEGLVIVGNAGGPAVVAVDAWAGHGRSLARLSVESLTALRGLLPPQAEVFNPVNVLVNAPAKRLVEAVAIVLRDPAAHAVLIMAVPAPEISFPGLAKAIAELPNPETKPLLACLMGGNAVEEEREAFHERGIPCCHFPEQAVDCFAAMYKQSLWKENPLPVEVEYRHDKGRATAVLEAARRDKILALSEMHSQQILTAYEVPCLGSRLARTSDEAVQLAKEIGLPVVLKIASPHILHKTEVQGISLGLDTADRVRAAFTEITARAQRFRSDAYIAGCLVQAMAPEGAREIIIGFKRSRRFGPLIRFGLGGIHTEAFQDFACRLAPLSLDDAHDMIREIRAFPVLAGIRGENPVTFTALEDILLMVSQIAQDLPDIQ